MMIVEYQLAGVVGCYLLLSTRRIMWLHFSIVLTPLKDLVSGKNFALTLPYVVLAYYWELDWAAGFRHVSGAASH